MIRENAKLWGSVVIGIALPLFATDAAQKSTASSTSEKEVLDVAGKPFSGGIVPRMPSGATIKNINGPLVFDRDNKRVIYEGGQRVEFKTDTGLEVFANRAEADLLKKKIILDGNLIIYQSDKLSEVNGVIKATRAEYDMETRSFVSDGMNLKVDGIILRSGNFVYKKDADGALYLEGLDASVTAEDIAEPNTWISADRIRIYPQDRFEFEGMSLYYDDVPFFYFPYLSHSLNPKVGYLPIPGMRSIWGPYLLNEYGVLLGNKRVDGGKPTADYLATLHLDFRSRRGVAYGLDVLDTQLEEDFPNFDGLSLYRLHDDDPHINAGDDEQRNHLDPDRWRVALHQMWKLAEYRRSSLRLKANVNMLSDEYVLRDFYPDIYQNDASPDNTVLLSYTDDTNDVSLLQRFVPNNFYIADQRTEFSYERIKSPFFNTPVMYEGRTSLALMKQYVPGFMQSEIRDTLSELNPNSAAYDYWERMLMMDSYSRIHTYHEFSASKKIMGFLNVTPRIGGGYTGYYDVENAGSLNQGIFYAGVDADFKFSRRYHSVRNKTFGLKGLNHIIQPHFTLAYVKTNDLDELYPRIDGEVPTTNPISLSIGRYTEIDSMPTGTVFRYGLRNVLMTQRDSVSHRWFSWDVFMDAYLNDPEDERDFSNLYSFMRWNPTPWMEFRSEMQLPVIGNDEVQGCREYYNYIRFMPSRTTEFSVGHRYLSQHSILEDNSQLDMRFLQRFSPDWGFYGKWRVSLLDGELDIQEYNIYHNMGSWYLGLGTFLRRNGGKNEFGIGISFTIQETGDHMPVKFL